MPSNKSILCVSESSDTCFLISNLLRQSDYSVTTACSAEDALRLIRDSHFDLYLLGKRYNDDSTINLCRQIREFDSLTPVVFYSGDTYTSSRQEALSAGAQAYILEPYLNELLEIIDSLFRSRKIAVNG